MSGSDSSKSSKRNYIEYFCGFLRQVFVSRHLANCISTKRVEVMKMNAWLLETFPWCNMKISSNLAFKNKIIKTGWGSVKLRLYTILKSFFIPRRSSLNQFFICTSQAFIHEIRRLQINRSYYNWRPNRV